MRNWMSMAVLIVLLAGSGWLISQNSSTLAGADTAANVAAPAAAAQNGAALASVIAVAVILALVVGGGIALAVGMYCLHRLILCTQAEPAAKPPRSGSPAH